MKPNYEKIIDGKPVEFKPITLDELFEAIRCDWCECYSTMLEENFVLHLN